MNSRRKFFARIAAVAATVAMAPEIAFGVKFENPQLDMDEMVRLFYAIKIRNEMANYYRNRYYND